MYAKEQIGISIRMIATNANSRAVTKTKQMLHKFEIFEEKNNFQDRSVSKMI